MAQINFGGVDETVITRDNSPSQKPWNSSGTTLLP